MKKHFCFIIAVDVDNTDMPPQLQLGTEESAFKYLKEHIESCPELRNVRLMFWREMR